MSKKITIIILALIMLLSLSSLAMADVELIDTYEKEELERVEDIDLDKSRNVEIRRTAYGSNMSSLNSSISAIIGAEVAGLDTSYEIDEGQVITNENGYQCEIVIKYKVYYKVPGLRYVYHKNTYGIYKVWEGPTPFSVQPMNKINDIQMDKDNREIIQKMSVTNSTWHYEHILIKSVYSREETMEKPRQ